MKSKIKQFLHSTPDLKRSNWSLFSWGVVFGLLLGLIVAQIEPVHFLPLWFNGLLIAFMLIALGVGLLGRFKPWLPNDVGYKKSGNFD